MKTSKYFICFLLLFVLQLNSSNARVILQIIFINFLRKFIHSFLNLFYFIKSIINVFERVNTTSNPDYCELNVTIGKNKAEFSTAFNLKKQIDLLMVNYELSVVSPAGSDKRKLLSSNFNWCKYLNKTKVDFISKVIYRALNEEKNHWMMKCPIKEVRCYIQPCRNSYTNK